MSKLFKIIYDEATSDGRNPNDVSYLERDEADAVVATGVAHFEEPPPQPEEEEIENDDNDEQ